MKANRHNINFEYKSNLTRQEKQIFRNRFSEKSILKGVLWNFLYLTSIYAALIVSFYTVNASSSFALIFITVFFSVLFCTRQMRGLENIVHFGSHNNFTRNRKLNDLLTNVLSAWPMLQDVDHYRAFHSTHHGEYASEKDPCRIRLEKIGANTEKIETNAQLLLLILKWMPQYEREFYLEIKSNSKQVIIFGLWHGMIALMITLVHSWQLAVFIVFCWGLLMFISLPFLRSIAELSEHDYERGTSVAETTFNNLGLLDHLLIHPAGDAWHSLHHLHPTVSWWNQGKAHRFLMKHDDAYSKVINRDKLIQNLVQFPTVRKETQA